MAEKCVFCKDEVESSSSPCLKDNNMSMFEVLMEQTVFDKNLLMGSSMCEDCNKTLFNFFQFKSKFMEKEDEFINYINYRKKVDLYDVLVKTFKLKRFKNENIPIKVCRICFSATQFKDYTEIKSLVGHLATFITACLPEINIQMTDLIHICTACNSTVLQYYHFLQLCIEAAKASSKVSDSLSRSDDKAPKSISKQLDPLLPVATLKRGRGRPRKIRDEQCTKLDGLRQVKGKKLTSKKNEATSAKQGPKSTSIEDLDFDHYECQICPALLPSLKSIKEHLKSHQNEDQYSCWRCGYVLCFFGDLCQHYSEHGIGLFKVVKGKEGSTVHKDSSKTSDIHENVMPSTEEESEPSDSLLTVKHTNIYFPLDQKQKRGRKSSASNSEKSKNEATSRDDSSNTYECRVCLEVFGSMDHWKKHCHSHKGQSQFVCWECGTWFRAFDDLEKHYLDHGRENLYNVIASTSSQPSEYKEQKDLFPALPDAQRRTSMGETTYSFETSKMPCSRCKRKFNGVENYRNHPCTKKYKFDCPKEFPILCSICMKNFAFIQDYMLHPCTLKIIETTELVHEKTIQLNLENEFRCGHCSSVYYSLDDLDEHVCISTRGDSKKVNESGPETQAELDSDDYQCAYCLRTFDTLLKLNWHVCDDEDLGNTSLETYKPPVMVIKESILECNYCVSLFETPLELSQHKCANMPAIAGASANTVVSSSIHTTTTSGPSIVKVENLFECPYCMSFFVTSLGLSEHKCLSMPATNSFDSRENTVVFAEPLQAISSLEDSEHRASNPLVVKQENILECPSCVSLFETSLELSEHKCASVSSGEAISGRTKTVATNDCVSLLIKAEPEYDHFLCSDSAMEDVKEEREDFSGSKINRENQDDGAIIKNVEKKEDYKEISNHEKKEVINKIAKMFGVKIVEGKDRNKNQSEGVDLNCVGCDFKGVDQKDLMFHVGFCNKLLRCNYCSYGTNISQKLEVHSWSVHKILIFVCSYCSFVTSMQDNYAVHTLTHKEFQPNTTVPPKSIEGNCQNNIVCISDEEEHFDGNSSSNSSATMLNKLFDFQNFGGNQLMVSEKVWQEINAQKKDGSTKNSIHSRLLEVTINKEPCNNTTSNPTSEAEDIWPNDSDEDLDDSVAFQIRKPEAAIKNIIKPPRSDKRSITTEPVWLVQSSVAQPEMDDNYSSVAEQNQSELIIPDKLFPDVLSVPMEPSQDPLTSTSQSQQDHRSKSSTTATESDQSIYIRCDSDSDSEFVESSESQISNMAACAEEAVPISASEASKLISEGVPVISGSSLTAMQIESSLKVVASSDKNQKSSEHVKDSDSGKLQPESTKPFHQIGQSSSIVKQGDHTVTGNADKTDFRNISNISREEQAADSDGSSIFVTDDEDNARDDNGKVGVEKEASASRKLVENPFLPVDIDDGFIISDDDKEENVVGNNEGESAILSVRNCLPRLPVASKKAAAPPNISVRTEDSFVISDDEDSVVQAKEPKTGLHDAADPGILNQVGTENAHKVANELNVRSNKIPDQRVNIQGVKEPNKNPTAIRRGNIIQQSGSIQKKAVSKSATIAPCLRSLGNTGAQSKNIQGTVPTLKAVKRFTYSTILSNNAQKKPPAFTYSCLRTLGGKKKNLEEATGSGSVVIEDQDANIEEVKSRSDSSSSRVVFENDVSNDAEKEVDSSGDDCVFVSEVGGVGQSKRLRPPAVARKRGRPLKVGIRRPPNAYQLFVLKVKEDMQKKLPLLTYKKRGEIILNAWTAMTEEERWPFKEEARLHRVLFKREHPEYFTTKQRVKDPLSLRSQPAPVSEVAGEIVQQPVRVCEDIEEIVQQPVTVGADMEDIVRQPVTVGADMEDIVRQPVTVSEDIGVVHQPVTVCENIVQQAVTVPHVIEEIVLD